MPVLEVGLLPGAHGQAVTEAEGQELHERLAAETGVNTPQPVHGCVTNLCYS